MKNNFMVKPIMQNLIMVKIKMVMEFMVYE
jgi:hypothetical protein